jgi:Zn-dependent M28 family amino/carboxypeptidase
MRVASVAFMAVVATALVAFVLPGAATSAPPGCANRTNTTYQQLLTCVTVEGVREHQAAFQAIADANNDDFYPRTRAAGTEGYANSVDYVAGLLEDAGYDVMLDEFPFQFQFPVVVERVSPGTASYESGAYTNSGFGDVTASVTPIDVQLGLGNTSTSGCEAGDFAGFPAGNIALIQRGTCPFALKVENAETAGASAVVIFNQGNTAAQDRQDLIIGTLAPYVASVPVVGLSYPEGAELSQTPALTMHVEVIAPETRTDVNVIAEKTGVNDDNVVMAGAHLDSETLGPGINDNGSGSAALLETALMMAKVKPENTLRFAWWGAEESGLVGSTAYVNGLSQAEKDRIAMYMNYDMVGSPNYIFMVYDADTSTFPAPAGVPIPAGSAAIEDVYESYYTSIGEPYDDTQFSGRSDYQAFILNGIPSGGLFTGAEEIKTEEQESIWDGAAGEQFDPCYHIACDTFDNVDLHALEVNSDLIAYAMLTFAFSTESVNRVPGRAVPGSASMPPPTPAGPEGTFPDQTP